jgi:phthiodiolone/phenolphthiodiolone dimycocerosates ketoreductase
MTVKTSIPLISDRFSLPSAFAAQAQAAAASGVVDELLVWDQMTNFWPRQLWSPAATPMATVVPDIDSYADAFAVSAYVLASAPDLGVSISTDAIRRGPAEMFQSMATLQNMTNRTATVMIGAGEAKQVTPFGWKRSEGIKRLEDQLQIFHTLWDATEPVTRDGNFWDLKNAWMGSARGSRPQVWVLGGGPKLLDLGTTYADGMAAIVPCVFPTPDAFKASVVSLKADLARKGRDPHAFHFGIWFMALVHEDETLIAQALASRFFRWMAGIYGRLDMPSWRTEGFEPPLPDDWHYATKLLPVEWSDAQVEELLSKVTTEMAARAFVYGTPESVADQVQPYIDGGATWVSVCDILPLALEPDDAQLGLARNIEICSRVKAAAR